MISNGHSNRASSRANQSKSSAWLRSRTSVPRGSRIPSSAKLEQLWKAQRREGSERGSWTWVDADLEPFDATKTVYLGTAFAALAASSYPGQPKDRLDELQAYLRREAFSQPLHNRLAWVAFAPPADRAAREAVLADLWKAQALDWRLDHRFARSLERAGRRAARRGLELLCHGLGGLRGLAGWHSLHGAGHAPRSRVAREAAGPGDRRVELSLHEQGLPNGIDSGRIHVRRGFGVRRSGARRVRGGPINR